DDRVTGEPAEPGADRGGGAGGDPRTVRLLPGRLAPASGGRQCAAALRGGRGDRPQRRARLGAQAAVSNRPERQEMSIPRDWPTAMVVLASEQLWPNIHGLAYWGGNLRHLFICSTNDKKSARPAECLEALCQEVWPTLRVHRLAAGIGMQPQEVHAQALRWRAEHPRQNWLLNVSGGTKLMHDGLLPLVGQEDTEVVYRELTGVWYRFRRGPILETELIDLPARVTDELPVVALIRGQWHMSGAEIEFGPESGPLDWRKGMAEGTRTRWDWRAVRTISGDR